MSRHLKTAKSLNTAVLVLSIIGLVGGFLLVVCLSAFSASILFDDSMYTLFASSVLVIILTVVCSISYIFSLVASCVVKSGIAKNSISGAPFVLSILNAVFCGLAGRFITMVLSIILAVELNTAKKEALPNI